MIRGIDWEAGTYLESKERQNRYKMGVFEKETKEKVHKIIERVFIGSDLSENAKISFEKYVYHKVWRYHTNLKRNAKPKPSLRGTPTETTIKAELLNALLGQYLGQPNDKIMTLIKKFESLPDYKEIKEKAEFLTKCVDPEQYYDISIIDKASNNLKDKSFSSLFKSGNNWPYLVDGLKIYSTMFGHKGWITAVKMIRRLNGKNRSKIRKGLCGACAYVLAIEYRLKWQKKFRPNSSLSAWAEVFDLDREVFKERVDFVRKNILPEDYVTPQDFELMILPAFL